MASKPKFNLENSGLFAQAETPEENVSVKKSVGRPRNEKLVRDNSVQEGLTADYTRVTFILEVELAEKLKDYAYTERVTMNKVIREYLDKNVDEKTLLHRPDNWR